VNYGIAIFPSKRIQDAANSYRKRYDPRYALIPPHITLKSPFTCSENDKESLIAELKHVANNMSPFKISIQKCRSFAPVNHTIYFKIEPNEEIQSLYREIHDSKFPTNEPHPFVPHITIAQQLTTDEYADVFGQLKMTTLAYEDYVDRFHLLYQLDNGSWTVYQSFVFGKEQL